MSEWMLITSPHEHTVRMHLRSRYREMSGGLSAWVANALLAPGDYPMPMFNGIVGLMAQYELRPGRLQPLPMPRTRCDYCGAHIPILKSGKLRKHSDPNRRFREGVYCPGSGCVDGVVPDDEDMRDARSLPQP